MYIDFYGLNEMPFGLIPDSRFLFLSTAHKEALSHLHYGIRERKGFILVTGEIGTGKTTLCRSFLNELGPNAETAFIMNTFLSETELLKSIVYDLMAECRGHTKKELIDQLNAFLLRSKEKQKNVVILIDECQNLSPEVMEQIRMLSNLETEREKLLQIILVGQPEVRDMLAMPDLRQLDQRIAVRFHLRPLSKREMGQYIRYRLEVAGLRGGLEFSRGALNKIYRYSGGTPRLINIICDRALLIGYVRNSRKIARKIVRQAAAELSEASHRKERESFLSMRVSPMRLIKATLAASIIFIALLGWVNRERFLVAERLMDTKKNEVPQVSVEPAPSQEMASVDEYIEEPLPFPRGVVAAERLLGLWGYKGSASREDTIGGLVERSNLKTVATWADLPFIIKLNLPCLLEVDNDYYVLERVDSNGASCWVRGGAVSVPLDELGRRWNGKALIVNQRISTYDPLLYLAMRGRDVLDIQKELRKLNYYQDDVTGHFDRTTEEAVIKLQVGFGLNADGIVGAETRLALWSLLASDDVPRLSR